MSHCQNNIPIIKQGETERLDFSFESENLSFVLTVNSVTTYPAIGDTYFFKNILLVVTNVDTINEKITFQSNISRRSDLPNSGNISRDSGDGDTVINYTSHESNNFIDLTGSTFEVMISDFYDSGVLPINGSPQFGVFYLDIASNITTNFIPGNYKASLKVINSIGEVANKSLFDIRIEKAKL